MNPGSAPNLPTSTGTKLVGADRSVAANPAVDYCTGLLQALPVLAERRVIDVSGDGMENDGGDTVAARNQALSLGITINGSRYIVAYYRDQVIGGPGAFLLPAADMRSFRDTIRLKLLREIGRRHPLDLCQTVISVPVAAPVSVTSPPGTVAGSVGAGSAGTGSVGVSGARVFAISETRCPKGPAPRVGSTAIRARARKAGDWFAFPAASAAPSAGRAGPTWSKLPWKPAAFCDR